MLNSTIKTLLIITFLIVPLNLKSEGDFDYLLERLDADSLKRNLEVLANDSMRGRKPGDVGARKAAEYIASKFNQYNLQFPRGMKSYFQRAPMHSSAPLKSSDFIVKRSEDSLSLRLLEDYLLYETGPESYIPKAIDAVFVGYGISAPEYDYNDYQNADVDGKIAVFLGGEPYSDNYDYFKANEPTIFSALEAKRRTALARGAIGCLLIPSPIDYFYRSWEKTKEEYYFNDISLSYSATGNFTALINPSLAEKLFKESGFELRRVYEMHFNQKMTSFPLNIKMKFKGEFIRRDFLSNNVAGTLKGSDPELKDSYLIITAHYDHLGVAENLSGDSIYNGAIDNAIGAAGVLELARVFSELETPPKRSILFLLTTGEEFGLLGSTYYTDHPIYPLYKTVANVNVDGLAFIDKFSSAIGVGAKYSTLNEYFEEALEYLGIAKGKIPPEFRQFESFRHSDQLSFAKAGAPSILIMDGPDYVNLSSQEAINKLINWSENVYHTPADDINQDIDFEAAVQHLKLIAVMCYLIAADDEAPEWFDDVPYKTERLRTRIEKR